ncbi:kinase-like domain-containing protein [Suillus variegatus]|nr:kinase-like domain-containing protein [Suillus variegatus]
MRTSKGTREVAVKVMIIDHNRAMPKLEKAMRRELRLWLRLKHLNIVPLLGIAHVESPWPALVYPWMPSGTLYIYLEKRATTLPTSTKVGLVKGVADGLYYLHSMDVVHGDLQPDNVLIGDSGNPCLTGFGLATVVGDPELQWNSTTAACDFNSRWRAPEVIGIESDEPAQPTYASDIYSFGSVMFFIISGNIPWKEKNSNHIAIALSRGATPARPENIPDGFWSFIERCWSRNPMDRPGTAHVLDCTDQCRIDDSQAPTSEPPPLPEIQLALAEDLTGQIFGGINDYVASGAFANVYRCEWRKPSGPVKVAVKTFRHHMDNASEQDLRRFRRETAIWAHLVHDNIVTLYGTTEGFGSTTALVSQWFPHGTLSRLITEQGATLTIKSKLKLLHSIASGLYYLHSIPIVHGDIASSNVLVDLKEGEYKACLTDFGLSNVLRGRLKECQIEESIVRPGAIRWTAPELMRSPDLPPDVRPSTQNDMYSFGRVMFHLLTLTVPWYDIDDYRVIQKIQNGEDIPRPEVSEATSDVTDARWDHIEQCWSIDPSARPCALTAMNFITGELEALKQDVSS